MAEETQAAEAGVREVSRDQARELIAAFGEPVSVA